MLRDELYKPWFADDKQWGFEIITGQFSGVVIQVNDMMFLGEATEDGSNFNVDYNVINKPDSISDEDVKTDVFDKTFEMIIVDIMEEAIQTYENDKQNRTDNPKESDSQ